jgi:hypothetical protein
MSHRSLFWPVALIAIAVGTLLLILISGPVDPRAARVSAADECPTESAAYESCYKTQTALAKQTTAAPDYSGIIKGCPTNGPASTPAYPVYGDCLQTRTAILLQTERAGYTATSTSPPQSNVQATSTLTPTPTFTPTLTQAAQETQPTATQVTTPSSTRTAAPTATEVLESEADASAMSCIPGETLIIEGSAAPEIALIVTFGGRPVGGGFSRDDGSYRIRLRIGDERPGIYPVTVEERTTSTLVQELRCRVPALTPTPTPPLVP